MNKLDALSEESRPLVHFTPERGYMNDPNGLLKFKDTYYLFFQHNPEDTVHGNTHWGMAVSQDLMHWTQRTPALCPDEEDGLIFSGSGVVDYENVSGLGDGSTPPILLFYTGTGYLNRPVPVPDDNGRPVTPSWWKRPATRQCIAYSTDGGTSFKKYSGNPVLPEYAPLNRDPKVNYVPEAQAWVLTLFLEKNEYVLFWSTDLLHWGPGQRLTLPATAECPDIFRLPLDGDEAHWKWVIFGSPENYVVGHFEGRSFVQETELIPGCMAAFDRWAFMKCSAYAPQTFFAPEEKRLIQISWIRTKFPGMRFQSQMSLPWELELVTTDEGPRLRKNPVVEAERLRKTARKALGTSAKEINEALNANRNPFFQRNSEALELCIEAELGDMGRLSFALRGVPVIYDHRAKRLSFPTGEYILPVHGNKLDLRIIADRGSMELFACGGLFNCVLGAVLDPQRVDAEFFDISNASASVMFYELGL